MLVIVIDIPGILAAKHFFYSEQTLDVAAVYEDAGQF